MERLRRRAIGQDGDFLVVDFEIPAGLPPVLRMTVAEGPAQVFSEGDIFSSLIAARKVLERDGYLLCCQCARPDVFPSGLLRQMNDGRFAYRLTRDHPLFEDDVVDCLAEADASEVGTVDQQKDFVFAFFRIGQRN